ncbi:hypothetical protein [Mesorhizobium sp. 14Argb]
MPDLLADQLFVARLFDLGGHLGRQALIGAVNNVHEFNTAGSEHCSRGFLNAVHEIPDVVTGGIRGSKQRAAQGKRLHKD